MSDAAPGDLSGVFAFVWLIIKWVIWAVLSGFLPGYRMESLRRAPPGPEQPAFAPPAAPTAVPERSRFRIISGPVAPPLPRAPAPAKPVRRATSGNRLRQKGEISKPSRCPICHTKDQVSTIVGGYCWHCGACGYEWN